MSTIPDQVGVFPLPQTVFFPHTLLPLYIFEPRYRALLADALGGSRRIAMAVLKPGSEDASEGAPDIYPTACVGRIVEHQQDAEGGSDLILKGEAVVRLGELVSDEPYRTATVRRLPDHGCFAQEPGAAARCEELRFLLERACPGCLQALREGWPGDFDRDCGVELLHTVAMHLPVEVETKLTWLRCRGSLERWTLMRSTLERMGADRAERRRVLTRYEDLLPEHPRSN